MSLLFNSDSSDHTLIPLPFPNKEDVVGSQADLQPSPNDTPRSSLDRDRPRPQSPDQQSYTNISAPLLPTSSTETPSYPPARTNGPSLPSAGAKAQPRMWDGALDGPVDNKTSKDLTNIKLAKNQLVSCVSYYPHVKSSIRQYVVRASFVTPFTTLLSFFRISSPSPHYRLLSIEASLIKICPFLLVLTSRTLACVRAYNRSYTSR